MQKPVKLILAVLLFLCVFNWPYAYYQFVRFSAMAGFIYLAYEAFLEDNKTELVVFLLLSVLFQPMVKIALGRSLWNVVDVLLGLLLLYSAMRKK